MTALNIVTNVIILINITLIGGILPLIERKYLSLIQRRVGPKFVGYKGRLQFIADALKMFLKGCLIPDNTNKVFFLFWPSFVLTVCYFFWLNALWGSNLCYFSLEYNIVFLAFLSILLNLAVIATGFFSKNKYALLGSVRTIIVFFCLELLLGVFFLILLFLVNSFNFSNFVYLQEEYPLIILFFIIISYILILTLIEICKSPFDLNEAETELVTGYHTEYGSFFFALFYLCEYFHLFFTSLFMIMFFTGI